MARSTNLAERVSVGGVKVVLKNLRRYKKMIPKNVHRGMKKAGLFLQRKSQEVVPVDTGHLKSSAFTRGEGEGKNFIVIVGYTASYAIYVHENPNAFHLPPTQWKFLEDPAKRYRREMHLIIAREGQRTR